MITVAELIELLEREDPNLPVVHGEYSARIGGYAVSKPHVEERFVTSITGETCEEETSERHNDGLALRALVIS